MCNLYNVLSHTTKYQDTVHVFILISSIFILCLSVTLLHLDFISIAGVLLTFTPSLFFYTIHWICRHYDISLIYYIYISLAIAYRIVSSTTKVIENIFHTLYSVIYKMRKRLSQTHFIEGHQFLHTYLGVGIDLFSIC